MSQGQGDSTKLPVCFITNGRLLAPHSSTVQCSFNHKGAISATRLPPLYPTLNLANKCEQYTCQQFGNSQSSSGTPQVLFQLCHHRYQWYSQYVPHPNGAHCPSFCKMSNFQIIIKEILQGLQGRGRGKICERLRGQGSDTPTPAQTFYILVSFKMPSKQTSKTKLKPLEII